MASVFGLPGSINDIGGHWSIQILPFPSFSRMWERGKSLRGEYGGSLPPRVPPPPFLPAPSLGAPAYQQRVGKTTMILKRGMKKKEGGRRPQSFPYGDNGGGSSRKRRKLKCMPHSPLYHTCSFKGKNGGQGENRRTCSKIVYKIS